MKTFVLTLSLILANIPDGNAYRLIGNGAGSCGSWTTHRRDVGEGRPITSNSQLAQQDSQWILGFLSGVGFSGNNDDDPLKDVDANAVWVWVDNYCRANPLKGIHDAAVAFYFAHPH